MGKVLPEYAQKEFNKYTSTTSTTVTTTTITTSTTTIEFNPEEDFDEDTLTKIAATDLTTLLEDETAGRKVFADADKAFRDALNSDDATSDEIAELKKAMVAASEAYNRLKEMVTKKTDDNLAEAEASAAASKAELDGALPIIPILAGGGGLIVLLIIVIVVVSTSGGGGGSGDGQYRPGDASVVAFENPMYDDPSSAPTQNPIAGMGEDDEEDGGLYDEPAFNAEEAEDEAAGGGYLDVEPDEESEAEESEESEAEESEAAESSEEESSAESDE